MNLEKKTGISIMKINSQLDEGPVCKSYEIDIDEKDSSDDLSEKLKPDLILMDVQMPLMGGEEAAKKIRSRNSTSSIPIIIISANAFTFQQQKALSFGVDKYLTKPVDFKTLNLVIQETLKLNEQ